MLQDASLEIHALEAMINGLKKKQTIYQTLRTLCEENKKTNTRTFVYAQDAAQIIGCTVSLLAAQRHRKTGPIFYKIGGRVQYDLADLLDYIDSCKKSGVFKERSHQ